MRVRQALHLALDRQAVLDALDRTEGVPASQLVSHDVFGYNESPAPSPRDLVRSRQLLAEVGYPDGIEVELGAREGLGSGRRQAATCRSRDSGHQPTDSLQLMESLYDGTIQFYLGGLLCASGDASDLLDDLVHTRAVNEGNGVDNCSGYSNPQLEFLIKESRSVLDMVHRRELLARANAMVMEDLPYVPLYVPDNLVAARRDLSWKPRADGSVRVHEIHWE